MFNEESLENAIMTEFENRGYAYIDGRTIQRNYRDVLLLDDLKKYLSSKYPDISDSEMQRAISQFQVKDRGDYDNNLQTLSRIREGFSIKRDDKKTNLWIEMLDFDNLANNIFKIINQFKIQGPENERIPDAIVFVNGIPLVVIEFKSIVREEVSIEDACVQLNTRYTRDIPDLFIFNAFTVISDGSNNRIGTVFTDYSNYYSWNKADADDPPSDGLNSLYTMLDGVFRKDRLLSIIRDFIYFPDESKKNMKVVCRYPQYFGATKLLENIKVHMRPEGDGKGGTYFGTTGCGKSFTMLFLSRLLMRSEELRNPTIILITDRDDLDNQLSKQFMRSKKYLRDSNVMSMDSGHDLRTRLRDVASGGVYLTTIQKFNEEGTLLSDRNNIIIISDEAHRSQLNLEEANKFVEGKKVHSVGFAKILHDSFPNATYVGFSGTPVDDTMEVFGPIVDEYTMAESEKDKITSKIVYEGRAAKVTLSDEQMLAIENYYRDAEQQGANQYQIEKSKKDVSKLDIILGHKDRLENIACDFIVHYEKRVEEGATVCGKAMFVCSSRRIAFDFYNIIKNKRPDWFVIKDPEDVPDQLDKAKPIEMVKIVATRAKDDPKDLYELCGDDDYRTDLQTQYKHLESNFKIAIVVDMWLTGFDVPFLDTMYLDKPIQKHTLIQAISRVNRIYPGKTCGLVVDYLGIKKELDIALNMYAGGMRNREGYPDSSEFVNIVKNQLSILDSRFHRFDSSDYFCDDASKQLQCLAKAMEFVQQSKEFESWFMTQVRIMKMAYNNCVYSDDISKNEVDRIYFYTAIRSMIAKITIGDAPDVAMMNRKVREMLERAIQSDQVTQLSIVYDDSKHDQIELLSDEYLEKIKSIPGSNTKFKLLERLARLAIAKVGAVNKLKADTFSDKFKKIVDKYNDRHVGMEEISDLMDYMVDDIVDFYSNEMIALIDEVTIDLMSDDPYGLTYRQRAFFDILQKAVRDFDFDYPEEKMVDMAKELQKRADSLCSVLDWSQRQDVRMSFQMEMALIMKKYDFPPMVREGVYEMIFNQLENYKKNGE